MIEYQRYGTDVPLRNPQAAAAPSPAVRTDQTTVRKEVHTLERGEILRIFHRIPTLECDRLILRRMKKSDAPDMYEYASNPAVTKYLTWDVHPNERFTASYLSYLQPKYRSGEFHDWAVTLRDDGKMIGTCGFTRFNFSAYSAEVGYVLNPMYWGRGIAPEALSRVIRFAFDTLQLNRVEARCMAGNTASRRVMEKVGMLYEGTTRDAMFVKGRFVSVETCSILRDEYLAMRARAREL